MRPIIDHLIATIRTSAAARWSRVRQLREDTRSRLVDRRSLRRMSARDVRHGLHQHRAELLAAMRGQPASEEPLPEPIAWGVDELLPIDVMRVVMSHPEGVRACDVGNELGVDWRRVLGITNKLVDAGIVERIGQQFYPVGKRAGHDDAKGAAVAATRRLCADDEH